MGSLGGAVSRCRTSGTKAKAYVAFRGEKQATCPRGTTLQKGNPHEKLITPSSRHHLVHDCSKWLRTFVENTLVPGVLSTPRRVLSATAPSGLFEAKIASCICWTRRERTLLQHARCSITYLWRWTALRGSATSFGRQEALGPCLFGVRIALLSASLSLYGLRWLFGYEKRALL